MPHRIVTFKIDNDLLDEVDSLAKIKGISRSELIRRALEHYIRYVKASEQPKFKRVRLYS